MKSDPGPFSFLFTTPTGLFWTLSYITAALFTWWVPNDVFERWPETRAFADFMASNIAQIERVTTLGGVQAGNANRFVYSVLWAVMPVYAGVYLLDVVAHRLRIGLRPHYPSRIVGMVAVVGIFLGAGQNFYFWFGDTSAAVVRGTMISWFGRGLWAPLFAFGNVFLVSLGFLTLYGVTSGQLIFQRRQK